jgi:hypothetical protein
MLAPLSKDSSGDHDRHAVEIHPGRLWSLWDMLENYFPIYQMALDLQALRYRFEMLKSVATKAPEYEVVPYKNFVEKTYNICLEYKLTHTSDMAKRINDGLSPETYIELYSNLSHLSGSIGNELRKEGIFRIPPERTSYYDQDDLFGTKVSAAFSSCERDIRKAGSCYALAQEDACVHHLMLVLERGLNALATKVGVTFHYADWQQLIGQIETKLKAGLPRGRELDFYRHVNAQFGFLKEAYRKHSAHARDDPYDMPKALSIFNHVKEFMVELEKGGLKE